MAHANAYHQIVVDAARFPFSLATWAALTGVSEDDYIYHQIHQWGRRNPTAYRLKWRNLLARRGVSIKACDRLLVATVIPTYDQTMRMCLHEGKARKTVHHHLPLKAVKALAIGLGLDARGLAESLDLPQPLPVIHATVQGREPTPLAERIAARANAGGRWLRLLRKRIRLRYGKGHRKEPHHLRTAEVVLDLSLDLGMNVWTCHHMLTPSQRHAKMWTPRKIQGVSRVMNWSLRSMAHDIWLDTDQPAAYRFVPLAPVVVGDIPAIGAFVRSRSATLRVAAE